MTAEEHKAYLERLQRTNIVNSSPSVGGVYTWMCEECESTWTEPDDQGYDRTKDSSGWPVWCTTCSDKFHKHARARLDAKM